MIFGVSGNQKALTFMNFKYGSLAHSKRIISCYYNKTNDKQYIIVKKKSINSLNNSYSKEKKNTKHQKALK